MEHAVFGGPLGTHSLPLVKRLRVHLSTVSALSTEGLFRLAGDTDELASWVAHLNAEPDADMSGITDPHVHANLLKRYLRLLNPPLLTLDLYDTFVEVRIYRCLFCAFRGSHDAHR